MKQQRKLNLRKSSNGSTKSVRLKQILIVILIILSVLFIISSYFLLRNHRSSFTKTDGDLPEKRRNKSLSEALAGKYVCPEEFEKPEDNCRNYVKEIMLKKNTDLIRCGREQRNKIENDDDRKTIAFHMDKVRELKDNIQTPIILLGFPKAGTTSISFFFRCYGFHVSHNMCYDNRFKKGCELYCSSRMKENLKANRPIFEFTGDYQVYAQMEDVKDCFFPAKDHIHEIHSQYPNATFILNTRNPDSWVDSLRRWTHVDSMFVPLSERILKCDIGQMKSEKNHTLALKNAYIEQTERWRSFCRQHSSHTCIEVPIDSPDARNILESSFFKQNGIHEQDKKCWRKVNVNDGSRKAINQTLFEMGMEKNRKNKKKEQQQKRRKEQVEKDDH